MDSDYIVLDYSRISSDHEFYKNIHRMGEFLANGFVWDAAGPSLCTPGDIRISYSVWEPRKQETISMLARREGDNIVPLKVGTEEVFFVRKGRLDREELLRLEAADVVWWRNFWRVWFVLACVIAAAVQVRRKTTKKTN